MGYDIIITSAARHKTGADKEAVARDFAAAWQPAAARGTKIIVVADNPGVSGSALQCVTRLGFSVKKDNCATPVREAFAVVDPLLKASTLVKGASLVDLRSFYCDASSCPMVIGNVIAYQDTVGHITGTFSQTLGPYLADAIKRAARLR
ncbi:hypothetical protein HC028_21950 [Planosporangium flavigriseum]|uniref:SGNH domain-containing protein n=1 Tax=Planosporangium flavigriseum TaxID=373681 RepID=A0A8J3LPW8_9ACTN|nr:SGNH hydrolase domain-containing protein [Planosporangium flavigriseum]NJC67143.1 hypothetical protein [Planosporangium flavigriseum]GIG75742.1 hypothetical protein Pfl04_41460 [Planosporangium flavigriseum]